MDGCAHVALRILEADPLVSQDLVKELLTFDEPSRLVSFLRFKTVGSQNIDLCKSTAMVQMPDSDSAVHETQHSSSSSALNPGRRPHFKPGRT